MPEIIKFNFDKSFAPEDIAAEEAMCRRDEEAPKFREEDVTTAREEGYSEGLAEGMARARGEIEQVIAQALDQIGAQLAELGGAQVAAAAATIRESADLAKTIAFTLAPVLMDKQPLPEVEALIVECLGELRDEPRVVVRAAEMVVDGLKERIGDIASRCGFTGQVVLLPDDALSGSDCRIEWADGGAERDLAAIKEEITEAVHRFASRSPHSNTDPQAREPDSGNARS